MKEIIVEIGNRYDNNLQLVAIGRTRRYGSYSLAEYVLVVRMSPCLQQLLFG